MRRELYNERDLEFIDSQAGTLAEIDKRLAVMDQMKAEITDLCSNLGKWVIVRTWGPKTHFYCKPKDGHSDFRAVNSPYTSDEVVRFGSPRDAEYFVSCFEEKQPYNFTIKKVS